MKLLSVTVPCYNSAEYMEKCVNSLLRGGDRVEIIIIDDGSVDRTAEIADDYAARYPQIIKVIHQENGGHGEGINQGIRHATGTYFKVVDSDDQMSDDFPAFLDTLEKLETEGGADLIVTNYYYVHTDGIGDRSIRYDRVLPKGRIFSWDETKRFHLHQLLTIHSTTFRTALMKACPTPLPKHVFYEDNLMVYRVMPHIRKMYYMDIDLYRYLIGRPDQSVQENIMKKRYTHQLLVNEQCFTVCHLDDVQEKMLKRYLRHELFVLFGISILNTRLNKSAETDAALDALWEKCIAFDRKWSRHFRYHTPLALICLPGRLGQNIAVFIYRIANRIVRFN